MPRICLVAPPYSGHLNPLLGLGRELSSIAEVTMISTPSVMLAVEKAGLHGYSILPDGEKIVLEIASPGRSVGANPFLLYQQLKANVSLQIEVLADLRAAFDALKPDLIIADFTLPVVGVAAKERGIPWWTNLPSPCVFETPDGPPAYFGGLLPADSLAEQVIHGVLRKLTRLFKRIMFFMFRRTFHRVGLHSIYREDGSERVYSPEKILACGIKEIEFPRTYPAHFQFTGPFLYTPPFDASEPEFIAGGKHVLVTLGSHLTHQKGEIARLIGDLAQQHPEWIFHFTDGDPAGAERASEVRNFRHYPFISYDMHLPRYDMVIHHGGSGILCHCLKHGIPAVVAPIDFDQFDNAARLAAAGVAVWAKSIQEIAQTFIQVAGNRQIQERCLDFSRIMESYQPGEDVRTAVKEVLAL